MSSDLQYKLSQLEYQAGQEPQFTEDEYFVADHMLQLGFEMLNDDATVYGCTLSQVLALLRARRGAVERSVVFARREELVAVKALIQGVAPEGAYDEINQRLNALFSQSPADELPHWRLN